MTSKKNYKHRMQFTTFRAWRDSVLGLAKSKFARNVAIVASGSAAAQFITLAFAPFLTRLYDPQAFGELGIFMAFAAIATPIAALTYPIAIVLPKSDHEAFALAKLSLTLSIFISAVATILLLAAFQWKSTSADAPLAPTWFLILPIFMLFQAWAQIGHQWLLRKEQFHKIARAGIIQSLAANVAKAGMGAIHPSGAVLLLTTTLGHALHAAMLAASAWRHQLNELTTTSCASRPLSTLDIAKKYRDFAMYRAPQDFINAASQNLPIFLLATLFGPVSAGLYTVARMAMGAPSALISKAVGDVFYPRIVTAQRKGSPISPDIERTTLNLIWIALIPFGLVFILGPEIFKITFGEEWTKAGEYARWLSIFFFFNFINRPAVSAIPSLGLQSGLLTYELMSTALKIVSLLSGFYFFSSDLWAVSLFSISGAMSYIALIAWVIIKSKKHDKIYASSP